jgi:hypothetical protein
MLMRVGTHEAVAALEQLARGGRLGKLSLESPYNIPWIAALAIAHRDAWPQVDAWLAGLIDQETPLAVGIEPVPQLGATAAALLLDRHEVSTRSFGLEPIPEAAAIGQMRFVGYRFASEKDRQDVVRWWDKQRRLVKPAAP